MTQSTTVRPAALADMAAISKLHGEAFGPGRFVRTAYRVREETPLVSPFCRVCLSETGELVAAVRFTAVRIGGVRGHLMLGPLAVAAAYANQGYGRALIADGLAQARRDGIGLVLLVGDEPYYGRLGFARVPMGQIRMPGPVDPMRLLAAELRAGALAEAGGVVSADA
ncbi:MAG: N-acetyltransferase [Hyphomicrobiaceae bacterium]|nr:N-acetyltransferase [Hyphomicrobiaceae bacterium]